MNIILPNREGETHSGDPFLPNGVELRIRSKENIVPVNQNGKVSPRKASPGVFLQCGPIGREVDYTKQGEAQRRTHELSIGLGKSINTRRTWIADIMGTRDHFTKKGFFLRETMLSSEGGYSQPVYFKTETIGRSLVITTHPIGELTKSEFLLSFDYTI